MWVWGGEAMTDEYVVCVVCGKNKNPIGRSAPLEMGMSLCDFECPGYRMEPIPSSYWPGERDEEEQP